MNHVDFYKLMQTSLTIGNDSLSVLKEDDEGDPEILGVRLVEFALKARSIKEFLSYFEKLSSSCDDTADFLLHLQIFLKGTELIDKRRLTLAQFRPTLFSKLERIETAFLEADREMRLKKLDIWIDRRLVELRETPQSDFLFKWNGPAAKFTELVVTLSDRKWIDISSIPRIKLAQSITKFIRFDQQPNERSIETDLKIESQNKELLEDQYYSLFHSYQGPYFINMNRNPGLKAVKPKANTGRRRAKESRSDET